MNTERPVNLTFSTIIRQPVHAVASFLHRVSGAFLFFGSAYLLFLLDRSFASEVGLHAVKVRLDGTAETYLLWLILVALIYHVVAGTKHLLLDIHVGDTHAATVVGSYLVIIVSGVLATLAGFWLW
ncbi:MAG: succinate dehydrogenase, cytochrome b556 subunit [Pseudomonadales bacterium]|nr:succinate dehydrogenase, cytochrome b556 subunit [Pseudomonadales bacterium]